MGSAEFGRCGPLMVGGRMPKRSLVMCILFGVLFVGFWMRPGTSTRETTLDLFRDESDDQQDSQLPPTVVQKRTRTPQTSSQRTPRLCRPVAGDEWPASGYTKAARCFAAASDRKLPLLHPTRVLDELYNTQRKSARTAQSSSSGFFKVLNTSPLVLHITGAVQPENLSELRLLPATNIDDLLTNTPAALKPLLRSLDVFLSPGTQVALRSERIADKRSQQLHLDSSPLHPVLCGKEFSTPLSTIRLYLEPASEIYFAGMNRAVQLEKGDMLLVQNFAVLECSHHNSDCKEVVQHWPGAVHMDCAAQPADVLHLDILATPGHFDCGEGVRQSPSTSECES